MATSLSPVGREQSNRGGRQGDPNRLDLSETSAERRDQPRPNRFDRERKLLFCYPDIKRSLLFHLLSFSGAVAVGLIVLSMTSVSWISVLFWWASIVAAEASTTTVNMLLHRRRHESDNLTFWANLKTASSVLQGLAWSLGAILLHVPGEPTSILAPAWGVLMVTSGIMFACASYPLAMYGMTTATIVPAALYLAVQSGTLERTVAVCMAASLPFAFVIGNLAVRNIGDLIESRHNVSLLLSQQTALSEKLKQSNAERTRFFSAASHDLRQPLQALGFYMTLLSTSGGREPQRDITSRLADCADHLDRQFNAILGVASTDEAISTAIVKPVRVQTILERVRNAIRPEAAVKGLDIRMVTTSAIAGVSVDLLERVLVNLAANAVRYTETGRILLGVRRRSGRLEIVVADTGIGIAAHELGSIFADFYQVRNSERHPSNGFGLGLGIVKRLCDGMGWEICVSSTPDRGSRFSILVPEAPHLEQTAAEATDEGTPSFDLTRLAVLLVDDDQLVVDATSRLLQTWSVEHIACSRSEEVLKSLSRRDQRKSWVVLLDYRLGDGPTGLEIAHSIRERHGFSVEIFLVTGEQDVTIFADAEAIGITVLRKPLKPIQLRAALMNVMKFEVKKLSAGCSDISTDI